MFTKEADWQQVTPRYQEDEADKDEDDDLQGAIVTNPKPEPEEREPGDYDVYCDSAGLHDWTVILDFSYFVPLNNVRLQYMPLNKGASWNAPFRR